MPDMPKWIKNCYGRTAFGQRALQRLNRIYVWNILIFIYLVRRRCEIKKKTVHKGVTWKLMAFDLFFIVWLSFYLLRLAFYIEEKSDILTWKVISVGRCLSSSVSDHFFFFFLPLDCLAFYLRCHPSTNREKKNWYGEYLPRKKTCCVSTYTSPPLFVLNSKKKVGRCIIMRIIQLLHEKRCYRSGSHRSCVRHYAGEMSVDTTATCRSTCYARFQS